MWLWGQGSKWGREESFVCKYVRNFLWVWMGRKIGKNDRFLSDEKLLKINVECRARKEGKKVIEKVRRENWWQIFWEKIGEHSGGGRKGGLFDILSFFDRSEHGFAGKLLRGRWTKVAELLSFLGNTWKTQKAKYNKELMRIRSKRSFEAIYASNNERNLSRPLKGPNVIEKRHIKYLALAF